MRRVGKVCRLISTDAKINEERGGHIVIFEPEDANTMKSIGFNVLGLVGVTLLLIIGAMILG